MLFTNRSDAGEQLANEFVKCKVLNPKIFAIPKGGIPIGFEIAKFLNIPLDIVASRKISLPQNRELALGAVSEEGFKTYDYEALMYLKISPNDLSKAESKQFQNIENIVNFYRNGKKIKSLTGRTAIIADDGVATGLTAEVAIKFLRSKKPTKLILATPVCSREAVNLLSPMVDEIVYLASPWEFKSVSNWYDDFENLEHYDALKYMIKNKHQGFSVSRFDIP